MGPILKRLWNDPSFMVGVCRSSATMFATLVLTGAIHFPEGSKAAWWMAAITPALALLIPAGDTGAEEIKKLKAMVEELQKKDG